MLKTIFIALIRSKLESDIVNKKRVDYRRNYKIKISSTFSAL